MIYSPPSWYSGGRLICNSHGCRKSQGEARNLQVLPPEIVHGTDISTALRTMRNSSCLQNVRQMCCPLRYQWHAACYEEGCNGSRRGNCPHLLQVTKERNHVVDGNPKSSLHARINRPEPLDLRSPERCFLVYRQVVWARLRGNVPLFPRPGPRHGADCRQPCRLVAIAKPDSIRRGRRTRRKQWVCRYAEFVCTLCQSRLGQKRPFRNACRGGHSSRSTARRLRQFSV